MELVHMAWPDVEDYLTRCQGIVLPVGSTEQHGPMGMIGTDTICAEAVARVAAERCGAIVAPAIGYTPAPFNTAFAGTLSISSETFKTLVTELFAGICRQGFVFVYVVNGHGANLAPLSEVASNFSDLQIVVRSWWDFEAIQKIRHDLFAEWEGMHATPSEISITQHLHRALPVRQAQHPPEKLSEEYIMMHSGDRHGPPETHRAQFPDGRVGSHSALARPEYGKQLLQIAARLAADEFDELQARTDRQV